MSLQKSNIRNIVLILMIISAAAMRLVSYKYPLLSNFTPVGAIALFGGAYFTDKWKAYLVPLLALFVSDIFINYLYTSKWVIYYSGSVWVYACFALMVLIGTFIKKVNVTNLAVASLASVAVHWLVMDLPWLYGTLYPHTLAGYGQSLFNAIPFESNMVLGDLLFGTLLFGGFEFAKNKYTILKDKKQLAL
ncbi:DUF6580 family putative transport protein [Mucilaginibacter segetis]|uniref:Uncharacterized protein n=1 Tax=Mucilaginibacter segetis TaxID=2793071 RepID=A0A934UMW7_9SPHI|nr:DUF6580 family putative transport protein [Mucilaginibacter segetis]MBK0379450.1 hypothetical protein [Mucilaginibacter segetis]